MNQLKHMSLRCNALETKMEEQTEIWKELAEHNGKNLSVVTKGIIESTQEMTKSVALEFAGRLDTLSTLVASLETRLAALEQVGNTGCPTSVTDVYLECDTEAFLDIETPLGDCNGLCPNIASAPFAEKEEEEEVGFGEDPFSGAEDMEGVEISDDDFDLHKPVQGNVYSNVRVRGPSQFLLSELYAQSEDEEFDVHPNEVHLCGSNKSGIGARALPNSAVVWAMTPGICSVLDPATCNH